MKSVLVMFFSLAFVVGILSCSKENAGSQKGDAGVTRKLPADVHSAATKRVLSPKEKISQVVQELRMKYEADSFASSLQVSFDSMLFSLDNAPKTIADSIDSIYDKDVVWWMDAENTIHFELLPRNIGEDGQPINTDSWQAFKNRHGITDSSSYDELYKSGVDSLMLQFALDSALSFVDGFYKGGLLKRDFWLRIHNPNTEDTWRGAMGVEVKAGDLFSNGTLFALVRYWWFGEMRISVCQRVENRFVRKININTGTMVFDFDSICDINGDGALDYWEAWYPPSGCCPRFSNNVYLQKTDSIAFSEPIYFINPSFFPEEKIVLGYGYGQPEIVESYAYSWNGYQLDTIGYVYPAQDTTESYYITKQYFYHLDNFDTIRKYGKRIDSFPDFYPWNLLRTED